MSRLKELHVFQGPDSFPSFIIHSAHSLNTMRRYIDNHSVTSGGLMLKILVAEVMIYGEDFTQCTKTA